MCDLQKMLDVCFRVGSHLDIVFNAVKSFLFKMGPAHDVHLCELRVGNNYIKWTDRLKYLSIQLISNRFLQVIFLVCCEKYIELLVVGLRILNMCRTFKFV